jgi:hypothetical protein
MPFFDLFLEAEIQVFTRTFSPAFTFISPFHYEDIGSIGAGIEHFVFIKSFLNSIIRLLFYTQKYQFAEL